MLVFTNLGLLLDMGFEFCVVVPVEQPLEDCLLNLLVVLLLEEVVVEKLHGCKYEHLAAPLTFIESADWAVRWETDWARRHDGHSRSVHI